VSPRGAFLLAGAAALALAGCVEQSSPAGPNDPLPSVILSPQQQAAQSCPNGGVPGPVVPASQVESALDGHVPHDLPLGQFGLAAAWGPVGGSATAGAAWADPECRTVRIVLDPNADVGSGPQFGAWTVTQNAECRGGLLSGATCLEYRTGVDGGTLVLSTIGLSREQADPVVSSVPL
jgi:hypothetical protein